MNRLENLLTALIAIAAVVIASVTVAEYVSPRERRTELTGMYQPPRYVDDWKEIARNGNWSGDSSASVVLVEFADFECQSCKRYEETLDAVKREFGGSVAVSFVHFPLPSHRFALLAARAAECASMQNRFQAMRTLLFSKQDSLGLKQLSEYAREAGVPDLPRFGSCLSATSPVARVDSGLAIGKRLQVLGTPTLMVNGWLYSFAPAQDELYGTVRKLLAGTSPF